MKTKSLQNNYPEFPNPISYLKNRTPALRRVTQKVNEDKKTWEDRMLKIGGTENRMDPENYCHNQKQLSQLRDDVISRFFRRDFGHSDQVPLERAAPAFFPPRAALESMKTQIWQSSSYFLGASMIGSVANCGGTHSDSLCAGLALAGPVLLGGFSGARDLLAMVGLTMAGVPASYNFHSQAIIFYGTPHRNIATGYLAHEMMHHFQNLNPEWTARHNQSPYGTALQEGPAIGYEHKVLAELAEEIKDDPKAPEYLYPMLRAYSFADQARLLEMAATFLQNEDRQNAPRNLDHALGYAAILLAEKEHGQEIYHRSLLGDYGFLQEA